MTAAYLPLTLQQGEPFSIVATITGPDLTGRTVGFAQIRTAASDAAPVATFAVTIAVGPPGVITVTAPAANVVALAPGGYVYDLFAQTSPTDLAQIRVLCGPVNVTAQITRAAPALIYGGY